MSLVKRAFSRWIDDLEKTPQILVGFSGGVDSSVLLHALVASVKSKHITAIHINHGLSKNADLWEIHARRFCEDLGLDFVGTSVSVVSDGSGLENAARTARYEVYESLLQEAGILLLGHHMDDQVETMLYRLMRGAGHKGMSGIPLKRSIGQGYLVRPLLQMARKDLEIYANDFDIDYIEDESNLKEDFDRNYLRKTIIPSIENRWPGYRKRFIEMARISDESDTLLESLAEEDIAKLDQREERAGWSLCLQLFKELDLVRQNNILRYWGTMNGMAALNRTVISEILSTIINSRIDSSPQICVGKAQFRRYSNRLYLLDANRMSECSVGECLTDSWKLSESCDLGVKSKLFSTASIGEGLRLLPNDVVKVAYRRGGERCQPVGRSHSTSLKKCLHEFGLEPWWRDTVPLIFKDGHLIAVADLWVCEGWQVSDGEDGIKIQWDNIS